MVYLALLRLMLAQLVEVLSIVISFQTRSKTKKLQSGAVDQVSCGPLFANIADGGDTEWQEK